MFEITHTADQMVAVKLSGKVTAEEVSSFYARFTPLIEATDRIGVVVDMSEFDDMSADAIARDIPLEAGLLDQMGKMPKVAIISDKEFIAAAVSAINPLVPMVDIQTFQPDQQEAAMTFASNWPEHSRQDSEGFAQFDAKSKNTIAFELDGYISADALRPLEEEINRLIADGKSFNLFGRIKRFGGFDPKLLIDGGFLKMKTGGIGHVGRYALVTDEQWIKPMIGFASAVSGINLKHFPLDAEADAWAWLDSATDA